MNRQSLPVAVTDIRTGRDDTIGHAAKSIGRSADRKAVFEAIYFGKKSIKTATEIANALGISEKRVLEKGKELVRARLVGQTKIDGRVAYVKDDSIHAHKRQI